MTFHSLYRLEQRGVLNCPIVDVAIDNWSMEQDGNVLANRSLRPANSSTPRSSSFAARFAYVVGNFTDSAIYNRVRSNDR